MPRSIPLRLFILASGPVTDVVGEYQYVGADLGDSLAQLVFERGAAFAGFQFQMQIRECLDLHRLLSVSWSIHTVRCLGGVRHRPCTARHARSSCSTSEPARWP